MKHRSGRPDRGIETPAHDELAHSAAQACGWHDDSSAKPDGKILRRLLALTLQRSIQGITP
ncbi:hypothetical protein [Chitinilyticum litopenaei]|uniref:hypothetical protein n=1 Tax=Chitinilyticum litopenaei TaxID=1121276 RepID=UPI00041C0D4B|nr:hypothetical protein [Chitinilyticum litopenaei]